MIEMSDAIQSLIKTEVEKILSGIISSQEEISDMSLKKQAKSFDEAYKSTEHRLYALKDLEIKLEDDQQALNELYEGRLSGVSKSIIRFKGHGSRLSQDDIIEAVMADTRSSIARTEHEIKVMKGCLSTLKSDPFYPAIKQYYFDNLSDAQVAHKMFCNPSTILRNRRRLVKRISLQLYGIDAIEPTKIDDELDLDQQARG